MLSLIIQGSRDDLSVGGGVTSVTRHGNSVDASFSKEVLNSIAGSCVCPALPLHAFEANVNKWFGAPPTCSFLLLGSCVGKPDGLSWLSDQRGFKSK